MQFFKATDVNGKTVIINAADLIFVQQGEEFLQCGLILRNVPSIVLLSMSANAVWDALNALAPKISPLSVP